MKRIVTCFLTLFFVSSCIQKDFPDYEDDSRFEQELQPEGQYQGNFVSLNVHLVRKMRLSYLFSIKNIKFYSQIKLEQGPPGVRFQQYIHSGARCPGISDDLNGDMVIDATEVLFSSGKKLIALDGSLRSREAGKDWFPVANDLGIYTYSRQTAIFHLMKDLRNREELSRSENLDLDQRTIIVYGSLGDPLLPIACAEIKKNNLY